MKRWVKGLLIACISSLLLGGGILVAGIVLGGTLDDAELTLDSFGWEEFSGGSTSTEEILLEDTVPELSGEQSESAERNDVSLAQTDRVGYTVTQFPAAQIQNLELELKNCMLTLQHTDDAQVSVEYSVNGEILIEKDGDTLEIRDVRSRKELGALDTLEVILYIPQTHAFDEVDLEIDAGDVQIQQLTAGELELEGGAGEVYIGELHIGKELDAELGVGDFYVEQAWLHDAKLTCGVGALEIRQCTLTGDLKVKGGVGDVVLGLGGAAEDYNYELTSGMGALEIFGVDYSTLGGKQTLNNHASRTVALKCGVGAMCIK